MKELFPLTNSPRPDDVLKKTQESWAILLTDKNRLEVELKHAKRNLDIALKELHKFRDAFEVLRPELADIWDPEPPCEKCDGTGGDAIYEEVSFNPRGFEEPQIEVTGHEDPSAHPCEDCAGTGVEIPTGKARASYIGGGS